VIHDRLGFKQIDPSQRYSKDELIDKKGKPVKISTIPDRSKGSFDGSRDHLSKNIVTEQVFDVATNLFKDGVDFDEDNADWMVVPKFYLPPNWRSIARTTPLMVLFPTEYPEMPPIGFYLKDTLPSPNGHVYKNAYHEASAAPIQKGWNWYCCYIAPGAWRPARNNWRRGDSLWTYFTLINEVLASAD
jgi:hypothetical protein